MHARRTLEQPGPDGCTSRRACGGDRYRSTSARWLELRGCRGRAASTVDIRGRPLCFLECRSEVPAGGSRHGRLPPRRLSGQLLLRRSNVDVRVLHIDHCSRKAPLTRRSVGRLHDTMPRKAIVTGKRSEMRRRRMSAPGQTRQFDRAPMTSGLPQQADLLRVRRHVSKVPTPDIQSHQGNQRPIKEGQH
jgi:hypothetical protein